ncbi:MAG: hypothetical protein ACE145_19255 [Terriglobia bacterium]
MLKHLVKSASAALMIGLLSSTGAMAANKYPVAANIATTCTNCDTDIAPAGGSGDYSLKSDGFSYPGGDPLVLSGFTPSKRVFALDTTDTLVNGLVAPGTRTVLMHFYSPVECKPGNCPFPNNVLPPCWGDQHDQDQAVNWAVFAPRSFDRMVVGSNYSGMARLNFNVRNAACDGQINRFRLEWPVACITRTGAGTWVVSSQACSSTSLNIGEAHLQAYGGTKKNTVDYGDWRMPFVLNLSK